jgi:hypothetical protein
MLATTAKKTGGECAFPSDGRRDWYDAPPSFSMTTMHWADEEEEHARDLRYARRNATTTIAR